MPPAVLVLGGSGFLGQYVVEELTRNNEYHVVVVGNERNASSSSPSTSTSSSSTSSIVKFVPGNLATGHGLLEAMGEAARLGRDSTQEETHGPGHGLAAVVNCAAISSPAECERDPARAEAVNVPTHLIRTLKAFARATSLPSTRPCCANRRPPFLVQLSTDQIYSGTRELVYSEDEEYYGDKDAAADPETGKHPVKSLWQEDETEKEGKDGGGDSDDDDDDDDGFMGMGGAMDDGSHHMQDFNPDSPAVRKRRVFFFFFLSFSRERAAEKGKETKKQNKNSLTFSLSLSFSFSSSFSSSLSLSLSLSRSSPSTSTPSRRPRPSSSSPKATRAASV